MLMEACRGDLVHESAQSSGLQRNDHLPALQRSDLAAGFAVERAEQLCGGLCNGANSPRDNASSQLCEAVHGAGERSLLGLRALASRCISIQLGKSHSAILTIGSGRGRGPFLSLSVWDLDGCGAFWRGGSLHCPPTAPSYIEDAECSAADRIHKGGARAPSALSPISKEPSLSTGSFDGRGAFLSGGSLLCPSTAPSYIEGAVGSTADRDHTGGARVPGLFSTIPNGLSLSIGNLDGGGAFLRGGSILCSPTAPSYVDGEGNSVSPCEQHEGGGASIDMITIFASGIATGR